MSVELLAVNAVTDRIARCARLTPEITVGDKTPITDGHIDFYHSDKKSNKTHAGRVPVQVKGRVTKAKLKAGRDTQSFSVSREVLHFFREHGGGIYFYVPMQQNGEQRDIYYANLLPFKIDRLLADKSAEQKTFSLKLTRLPDDSSKIESIVRLAWQGRTQLAVSGNNGQFPHQAEKVTTHPLVALSESRPTKLALDETDYVVVAHLHDGLEVPVDVDLELFPSQYIERDLAVSISCGGVEFSDGTGRRIGEDLLLLRLSSGLELKIKVSDEKLSTNLNLTRVGSFTEQAKDFDFMLAAADGEPLLIGETVNESHAGDAELRTELREIRTEISMLIELFAELGIDDTMSSQINLDDRTRQTLVALHQGLVQDSPVRSNSDGTGRYDIALGDHKIVIIVAPAEDPHYRRIIDPFDPTKRDRFHIYSVNDDGVAEPIERGTVYDSVTPAELATTLNLRLHHLVPTYEEIEDRGAATNFANHMVLRLLTAFDIANNDIQRDNLLQGAASLCQWLLQVEPDSLIHRINWWQILHRRGELTDVNLREIRATRRKLERDDPMTHHLEACLLLLLQDEDELHLVLEEMSDHDITKLHSWPIWSLRKPSQLGDQ